MKFNREPVVVNEQNSMSSVDDERDGPLMGAKSPGVRRIEALAAQIGPVDRIFIFIGIFLVAYAYGLDGTIRYTYQVHIPHPLP